MNVKRTVSALLLLVGLTGLSGCGSSMGQVEGKIVWPDGAPAKELANGQVIFESQQMRITARGQIGPNGEFTLRTAKEGDGAQVGEYDVAILEHRVSIGGEGGPLTPQYLPDKYYDFKTSGLKATVKSGNNPITLTVERQGKK